MKKPKKKLESTAFSGRRRTGKERKNSNRGGTGDLQTSVLMTVETTPCYRAEQSKCLLKLEISPAKESVLKKLTGACGCKLYTFHHTTNFMYTIEKLPLLCVCVLSCRPNRNSPYVLPRLWLS